jgi:hypothetical protein
VRKGRKVGSPDLVRWQFGLDPTGPGGHRGPPLQLSGMGFGNKSEPILREHVRKDIGPDRTGPSQRAGLKPARTNYTKQKMLFQAQDNTEPVVEALVVGEAVVAARYTGAAGAAVPVAAANNTITACYRSSWVYL